MSALLSLADLKAMLRMTSTASDADLQSVLNATTRVIEARVGAIDPATYTRTFLGAGDALVLGHTHVTGVSALTLVSDGSSPVTLGSNLVISEEEGIVRLKVGTFPSEPFQVTYSVGRTAPFPANLVEAAKIIAQDMFLTRRGNGTPHGQGGDQLASGTSDYLIPRRAQTLLGIDAEPFGFA